MPELPDLAVFADNLHRKLAGKKLDTIIITKKAKLNVTAANLKKAVQGQKLVKVWREGKELRFAFNKNVLGVHLMLHGKLYWADDTIQKFTLAEFIFSGGEHLALSDFQGNARITLNPEPSDVPDALSKTITLKFWKEQLQSRATIKNLLLDQHVIRGIGNAYADEILWQARISPFSISNKIPAEKIAALAKSVKAVLQKAEKQIRKKDPGIIGGEIRDFMLIHHAKKKASPSGRAIKIKVAGGRKTYYTEEQRLYN